MSVCQLYGEALAAAGSSVKMERGFGERRRLVSNQFRDEAPNLFKSSGGRREVGQTSLHTHTHTHSDAHTLAVCSGSTLQGRFR